MFYFLYWENENFLLQVKDLKGLVNPLLFSFLFLTAANQRAPPLDGEVSCGREILLSLLALERVSFKKWLS